MPISKHYKGKGRKVLKDMEERYGKKKGKEIFYAVENKQKKRKKK